MRRFLILILVSSLVSCGPSGSHPQEGGSGAVPGRTGAGSVPDLREAATMSLPGCPLSAAAGLGQVWIVLGCHPSRLRGRDSSLVRIDSSSGELYGQGGTGFSPDALTIAADSVWVAGWDGRHNLVKRLDPVSGQLEATYRLEVPATDLAGTDSGIWALTISGKGEREVSLLWLDPSRPGGVSRLPIQDLPRLPPRSFWASGGFAAGGGSVWVLLHRAPTSHNQILVRVDEAMRRVTGTTTTDRTSGVAAEPEGLWIGLQDGVIKVDAESMQTETIKGPSMEPFRADAAGIWFIAGRGRRRRGLVGIFDPRRSEIVSSLEEPTISSLVGLDPVFDSRSNTIWVLAGIGEGKATRITA